MGMQRFTYYYKKFVYTRISFFVMCVFCVLNGSIYAQTADFTADTTKGCVPMQVSFTDLSSGNPVAWEWDMGDGSSHIYIQNPTFVYNHPGTYDVTLTVTYADNSKKLKTIKNYITASSGPYVNFSSDITTACQYQSITFSDTVIPGGANVKSLLWDFGDGGTSTQNNPGYSYRDAGQYKVSLTAYNQMGCATKTEKVSYVTIYPNPVADFMADSVFCVQSASETKSVNFVNNSSNFISSLWQFHDGTTSTQTNPTKVFGIGDHDVTLIVTSDKGCKDTLKKSDYISVHIFNADFTVSDTIVCDTNTQITFYGLYGVQYTWSFGDGANGIGMKPNHTYQKSGKYTVSLYATSSLGCKDTVVKVNYISVYDSISPVIIIRDTLHCDTNAIITFKNKTIYASTDDRGFGKTVWDVKGDSSILLLGDSVTYSYGQYGIWGAKAYITTPYGCKLPMAIDSVKIIPFRPLIAIDRYPGGCAPLPVNAGVRDLNFPIIHSKWRWGNGDSTLVNGDIASYTYNDTGIFNVEVIATSSQGCVNNSATFLMIGFKPLCSFTSTATQACKSQFRMPVVAYDSLDDLGNLVGDAPANAWFWNHNGRDITLNVGNYNEISFYDTGLVTYATLVCAHYYCLSDTVTKSIQAYVCPPIARIDSISYPYMSINYNPYLHPNCNKFPMLPDNVNGSIGANLFRWNFGNDYDSTAIGGSNFKGDTSSLRNPPYQYKYGPYLEEKDGNVYIMLIAVNDNTTIYNACGYCEDTVTALIRISVADMRLRITDQDSVLIEDICQNQEVYFWDSSFCTSRLTNWGLRISDSLHPSVYLLDTVINYFVNTYDSVNDTPLSIRKRIPFHFSDYGVYYAYLYNADTILCGRDKNKSDSPVMEYYYDTLDLRMDTLRLVVYPRSVPDCAVPSPVCADDTVVFSDLSYTPSPFNNFSIKEYLWTSAGQSDTASMPKFVYHSGGKYDVSLRVINEKGCDSTRVFLDKITVFDLNAYFSKSTSTACNHELVSFRNLSNSVPTLSLSYFWDFNGEDTATSRNAQYAFHVDTSKWVYITLTAYDEMIGCVDVYRDSVYIRRIYADFDANENRAACPTLQCYFSDQSSTDSIVSWEWDFGDTLSMANTSPLQNPSHNYAFAGSYDVRLIVTDNIGCVDTILKENYVVVNGPYGYFDVHPTSGCYPLTVAFSCNFINVDTLMIITGDGNTLISDDTTKSFSFTYQNPGPYIPSMRLIKWVYDSLSGEWIRCVQNFWNYDTVWAIQVMPNFLTDSIYCQKLPIIFKNLTDTMHAAIYPPSLFNEAKFYWHYGEGDWDSLHFDGNTSYDTSGIYDVSLKVVIRGCTATLTKSIQVFDFPDVITSVSDTAACDSVWVEFTADSLSGLETSFDWVFHDGEAAKGNPVKHLFTSTGTYPYSLTLTFFDTKCIKTYLDSLDVFAWISPTADFIIQNKDGRDITDNEDIGIKATESAYFVDQSQSYDGQIVRWIWDYGDLSQDTLFQSITLFHSYTTTSGIVKVKLYVIDENGCESAMEHLLLVLEALRFPNVFTPNNDGVNDYFFPIEVVGYFLDFEMIIYNRWGAKVWERRCGGNNCPDYNNENFWWDGKIQNGKDASEGVYYWVVTALPKSQKTTFILHGSVSLFR